LGDLCTSFSLSLCLSLSLSLSLSLPHSLPVSIPAGIAIPLIQPTSPKGGTSSASSGTQHLTTLPIISKRPSLSLSPLSLSLSLSLYLNPIPSFAMFNEL